MTGRATTRAGMALPDGNPARRGASNLLHAFLHANEMEAMMKAKRWQDWVMLILGIWLLAAPFWMSGYASHASVAAGNSYIFGILVIGFAWAALATMNRWEEWVELAIGIWLVVSPFVLRFWGSEHGAAVNTLILGILVLVDATWALREATMALPPPTRTGTA